MIAVERQHDASLINSFFNHPAILPWVIGNHAPPIDVSRIVSNPAHVVLCGETGGIAFIQLMPGYYEAHTAVLPEGRGRGTLELGLASLDWMFCHTNAVEIMTRVPVGNVAALAAMRAMGMPEWFTTLPLWPTAQGRVPMRVYKLRSIDWIEMERERLAKIGELFHLRLGDNVDHDEDPIHDAYVGAAISMIRGGQPDKAMATYNLWAMLAGYQTLSIVGRDPLEIDVGTGIIELSGDSFTYRVKA